MRQEGYRYERKFVFDGLSEERIVSLVLSHPALFWERYPPREISNLYLDSSDYRSYRDHIDGVETRMKVRIRWYDEESSGLIPNPTLELKCRSGLTGWKIRYGLSPINESGDDVGRALHGTIFSSSVPAEISDRCACLRPTLFNRYWRRYFESADGRIRLTVDSEFSFSRVHAPYPVWRYPAQRDVVVEVKYEVGQEEHAHRVLQRFPFRLGQNSKYVSGIEILHRSELP